MSKKSLFLVVLFCNLNCFVYSQMLDKELQKFKNEIVENLKRNNEIADISSKNSLYYEFLYSRKIIKLFPNAITYYEVGLSSDHCLKYLAVIEKDKILFYPTKNFDAEFQNIVKYIKNSKINIKATKLITSLEDIKYMYDYNKASINNRVQSR
jgi:hypothetical protein